MPVDAYGVGSALIRGENDFTADVVMPRPAAAAKRGILQCVGSGFAHSPSMVTDHG